MLAMLAAEGGEQHAACFWADPDVFTCCLGFWAQVLKYKLIFFQQFKNQGPQWIFCLQVLTFFYSGLNRMLGYFSVWVCFGLLSPFLQAVGAVECSEKETVVFVKPNSMKKPTDCLIECSLRTYEKKLELQDNHNIRMLDSKEGKKVFY